MLKLLLFLLYLKQSCSILILNNASFVKKFDSMKFSDKLPNNPLPKHLDYREDKIISPVKNQKNCSAGWAFAIVADIETKLMMLKNGHDTILSEQFLIDCSIDQPGCYYDEVESNHLNKAYGEIITVLKGIMTEKHYPYMNGRYVCGTPLPPEKKVIPITGFYTLEQFDEDEIARALVMYGPVVASISSGGMANYKKGTIDEPNAHDCRQVNHVVLIVGFSVAIRDDGSELPYWIIKNSWGTEFGNDGYYYMVRGRSACSIGMQAIVSFIR